MKRIVLPLILSFLITTSAYASIPELEYIASKGQHITDDDVRRIAIEKNIIPENTDKKYQDEETKKKHTITLWIVTNRKDKVSIVDRLKELFKRDGVTIRLASEYYVNEINGVIYNSILKGDITSVNTRGMGTIFKTIAIMEGDYDNGKNKVELAREHMGQEIFQMYKVKYPEKYKKLLIAQ